MRKIQKNEKSRWLNLGMTFGILLLETVVGYVFATFDLSEIHIFTIYVLGILVTAMVTASQFYSIISVFGIFVFNYFFAYPLFSFSAFNIGYPITFIILLIAAIMTGTLAKKNAQHSKALIQTAYHTQILLEMEQLLQKAKCQQEIIEVIANRLMKILERNVIVFVVEADILGEPQVFLTEHSRALSFSLNQMELDTALWVFHHNKNAGAYTEVFEQAKGSYMPICTEERIYGVIGIDYQSEPVFSSEASLVLGECALAFEREYYNRAREEASVQARNEKLRSSLLRSISHDLRTPLTSISGNAAILSSQGEILTSDKRKTLSLDIWKDATALISMVENLLAITKLEEVKKNISMAPELLEDILVSVVNEAKKRYQTNEFFLSMPEDNMIIVSCNAQLIYQVMCNLLDNAVKYTKEGTEIYIQVSENDKQALIEVADQGDGIPEEARDKIFEMFYTTSGKVSDRGRGFGIGLALCKEIIEAHGGKVWVEDAVSHGAVFKFTLKKARLTIHDETKTPNC
nr:ATP-binding protein [uncultured Lachnoclostridium sp.]